MPEYHVSWVIDAITADSPEDAARQCREMLLDPSNTASVFLVQAEEGAETEVDLLALSAVKSSTSGRESLVCEGWWHPNVKSGQVHLHPESPGGGWSVATHRLCEPVYTKRSFSARR